MSMTYANTKASAHTMLTLRDIERTLEAIRNLPEPWAELMVRQRTPPSDWVLFVPEGLLEKLGQTADQLPEYVRASPYIAQPFAVSRAALMEL